MIKFSSIIKKINVKPRKIILQTDMKHLFTWNMGNFKFTFLSQDQLGNLTIDNFLIIAFKMLPDYELFFGNFIFALIGRMFSGNRAVSRFYNDFKTGSKTHLGLT